MLGVDGVSLRADVMDEYLTYLEDQVTDIMREVYSQRPKVTTPAANQSGTSGGFRSPFDLPENYTTPGQEPGAIKSGVRGKRGRGRREGVLIPLSNLSLQPCFKGTVHARLVPETASTRDLAVALNGFYDDYLDKCLKDNMAHANQLDINDGETNTKNLSKVMTHQT
jgi:hypothetical protein